MSNVAKNMTFLNLYPAVRDHAFIWQSVWSKISWLRAFFPFPTEFSKDEYCIQGCVLVEKVKGLFCRRIQLVV